MTKPFMICDDIYNESLDRQDESYDPVIKLYEAVRCVTDSSGASGSSTTTADGCNRSTVTFVVKWHFAEIALNDRLTRNHHEMFGAELKRSNSVMNFCVNGKEFYVLATDRPADFHFTGDTQCLPLYRYTADGERVSNITE